MVELSESNFMLYAIKHYHSPGTIGMEDLEEDLKRIKYLKRLLNRFDKTGEANERLVLNHLVVLYNVFGDAATDMLFFKLSSSYWSILKTYLVFLQRMPMATVVSKGIKEQDIPLDTELLKRLKSL